MIEFLNFLQLWHNLYYTPLGSFHILLYEYVRMLMIMKRNIAALVKNVSVCGMGIQ